MSGFKSKVNDEIKKLAGASSKGQCAKYVREAIQLAKGLPVKPVGIESAKDFGPWLIQMGYSKSSKKNGSQSVGDVAVFDSIGVHVHGHIEVYCDDGKWRSDFVQKSFYPFADGSQPSYIIYE